MNLYDISFIDTYQNRNKNMFTGPGHELFSLSMIAGFHVHMCSFKGGLS
jgi:hypothetical protein